MSALRTALYVAALASMASCANDGKAFELAEQTFNAGQVEQAEQLYTQFIIDYPTSEWRPIAERQLEKVQEVLEHVRQARDQELNQQYGLARETYLRAVAIVPTAVDTASVFARLASSDSVLATRMFHNGFTPGMTLDQAKDNADSLASIYALGAMEGSDDAKAQAWRGVFAMVPFVIWDRCIDNVNSSRKYRCSISFGDSTWIAVFFQDTLIQAVFISPYSVETLPSLTKKWGTPIEDDAGSFICGLIAQPETGCTKAHRWTTQLKEIQYAMASQSWQNAEVVYMRWRPRTTPDGALRN